MLNNQEPGGKEIKIISGNENKGRVITPLVVPKPPEPKPTITLAKKPSAD